MFSLIKKDFITSIRVKGFLYLILVSFIIAFVMPSLFIVARTLLPIGISYLFIMNTFYYDDLNKTEEFMLSIPTKRDDVVYARYLFSTIMILVGSMVAHILFAGVFFDFLNVLVYRDVVFATIVVLLSFSLIIPMLYKFGYKVMRILAAIIVVIVYFITNNLLKPLDTKMYLIDQYGTFPITISGASMYKEYSKFYTFIVDSINIKFINYTTITIFMAVVFIISMLISIKIYNSKASV